MKNTTTTTTKTPELDNDFLGADYEAPASNSRYMKLLDGENNFRILSRPILGWVYWNKIGKENKPVRLTYTEENGKKAIVEAKKNPDPKDQKAKHFWAMKVWNYSTERIEILELTQKSIQEVIRTLSQKKGWGSPVKTYDISIDRSGAGVETEYQINPIPPSPLDEEIEIMLNSEYINLNALFYSEDPFDTTWKEPEDLAEFTK